MKKNLKTVYNRVEKKLRRHILHKSSIILQYENTYSVHLSVSSEVKHQKICQSTYMNYFYNQK